MVALAINQSVLLCEAANVYATLWLRISIATGKKQLGCF